MKRLISLFALLILIPTFSLPANAGKVRVKNCATDNPIWVCSFNKKDSTRSSPAERRKLGANHTETLNCTGNKCWIHATDDKAKDDCGGHTAKKITSKKYLSIKWANHKGEYDAFTGDFFSCASASN
jgi:hypothetical protein